MMLSRALLSHVGVRDEVNLKLAKLRDKHPSLPRFKAAHGADNLIQWKYPEQVTYEREVVPFRLTQAIILGRDPRDVMISRYFHRLKRAKDYRADVSTYVHEREGGFETICRFLRVWYDASERWPERVLRVRYEDLHERPEVELRRMLDFMGFVEVPNTLVSEAVAFSRFDNMRKLELNNATGETAMMVPDKKDKDSFKTRKGKVGGFVEYLDAAECAELVERMNAELDGRWGYRA